jgi:hypothetical protein
MVTTKDILNLKAKIFNTSGLKSQDAEETDKYIRKLQQEDYNVVVFYKGYTLVLYCHAC